MTTDSAASTGAFHDLAAHEAVLMLETDPHRGLTSHQATERFARFGPNKLPTTRSSGALICIARQFNHPLIYVLLAAGTITAGLGELVDSAVIFGVVLVNAIVGFVQESRAEDALEGLRTMVRTHAAVMRDGHRRTMPSDELVPGDLILLEAGDQVPADMRLLRSAELRVDESALTGEAEPIAKGDCVLPATTPLADRRNMVYSGTLVTTGSGAGIAMATGAQTEFGEIHRLVGAVDTLDTPLTQKLAGFSKVLTIGILALAAVTFAVGLVRRQDATETFTAAVALAVGAIPEGLPAAVTITLAIGVARMARRRAVVRSLPSVETLGGATVICSDKTGTLTENQMTVQAIWTPTAQFAVTGSGYAPRGTLGCGDTPAESHQGLRWSLLAGLACNDSALVQTNEKWDIAGDPTEGAMLVVATKAGLDAERVAAELPRVETIPFDSERQYMATLHHDTTSAAAADVLLAKGAIERIVALCDTQMDADGEVLSIDRDAALHAGEELAAKGLRVLATAMRRVSASEAIRGENLCNALTLTGLQAMHDPPRTTARSAVSACRSAGIEVKMITGDHVGTATAIAREVGLLDGEPRADSGVVLTGDQLAAVPAEYLPEAVEGARVFARVTAEQKLRLVEALQERGHVVAMTGDGVNDAPALRQADIGVAMGKSGTEVAKDAADVVLTDDDFATIEAAVEEGRAVFDNLNKFITWTLPTNIAEGMVILVAIMLGAALPILPTQILWINMTTALALGLMLAFEPKETGIMTRPPRPPDTPLLTRRLVVRILLVSTLLVAGSWWLYEWELANGASPAGARTVALNVFVVVEAVYLFSCRSLCHSVWRIGLLSNRWIIVGVLAQAVGQLAITYLPAMNAVFDTAPIGIEAWLRILAVAAAAGFVVAVDKRLGRPLRAQSARLDIRWPSSVSGGTPADPRRPGRERHRDASRSGGPGTHESRDEAPARPSPLRRRSRSPRRREQG